MRDKNNTDGFIRRSREIGAPTHHHSYQPSRNHHTPTLDSSARRADGFHPSRQAPGGIAGTATDRLEGKDLLDEPIVLDDMPIEKRKDKVRSRVRRVRLKKVFKRASLVIMALLITTAAIVGYKFYSTQKQVLSGGGHAPAVCNGDVPLANLKKEGDGRVNILLLGIGSEGTLTDTILIASLDPVTDKVDLLSIPRDLWVSIPNNGQHKINESYVYGLNESDAPDPFEKKRDGVDLVDKVLENVTGVTIHYHAVFDFTAFKQIVDALGGVTVNVPETLYDPTIAWENHYNPVIATKGIQEFDGAKALLYAKSRQTSSDFARAERQQLLLVAIKDKALSLGTFSNPLKVVQLMNSLGRNVFSDFDTNSIQCLYRQISQVQSSNIKSLDLVNPPNDLLTTGPYAGLSIVRPKAGLFAYDAIQAYVRSTFRDGFLTKENASVAVYNATTTAGLATSTAKTLKDFGYNVTVVENAPSQTNPANTTVVDLSDGKNKYTRNYLEKRFGVSATGDIPGGLGINPPEGVSFVIIVGTDAANNN